MHHRRVPVSVAAIASVLALVVGCGSAETDDADSSQSPSSSAASDSTAAPTDEEGAGGDQAVDMGEENDAILEEELGNQAEAAKEAVRANFPLLLPLGYPKGWTAGKTSFDKDLWQLEVDTPKGAVVLNQRSAEGDLDSFVDTVLAGARKQKEVDLKKWQTGVWTLYSTDGSVVLARKYPTTQVGITARDEASATTLAKYLLTFANDPRSGDE